jgi:two-component system, NarL family, nitrate/nitrite response regulator NarL
MTNTKKAIRIAIVDDQAIFRDGLKALLSGEPEFQVVGEASNGEQIENLIKSLKPDILLIELPMPSNVMRKLAKSAAQVRTIIMNGALNAEEITQAFKAGVRGVLPKQTAASMLFKCIRTVMAGQYWIGQQSAATLSQTIKQCKNCGVQSPKKNFGLTPREIEIVRAVASGHSNSEIAGKLSISEQTVKHHITNIFDKLGVYNRLELSLFVFNHSLIEE